MERLVKAQALQSNSNQMQSQIMATRKTLELNPDHPIIKKLEELYNQDTESPLINNITTLMYQTSLLSSGFTLPEPTTYTNKINRLLALGLDIDDIDEWNGKHQVENSNDKSDSEVSKEEGDGGDEVNSKELEGDDDNTMEEVD